MLKTVLKTCLSSKRVFNLSKTAALAPIRCTAANYSNSTAVSYQTNQAKVRQKEEDEIQAKTKTINPLSYQNFFQTDELVDLGELFKARVHYGHDAGLRCPWMNDFVFGTRIRTDIIDLDKTVEHMRRALNFIAHIAFRKGIIVLFTRYAQHIPIVERLAAECGEYAYCKQWKNGSFTDSTRRYGSVIRLPDLCIFFHTQDKLNESHQALNEAAKMLIPTVAICDTDIDPSEITYPIPGNDDSMASLHLYARLVREAIMRGKAKREQLEKEGYSIELAPPPS